MMFSVPLEPSICWPWADVTNLHVTTATDVFCATQTLDFLALADTTNLYTTTANDVFSATRALDLLALG